MEYILQKYLKYLSDSDSGRSDFIKNFSDVERVFKEVNDFLLKCSYSSLDLLKLPRSVV